MKTALELMEDHAKALEAQRDALAAQLATAYDTLDYFGHSPPYDGSQAAADKARIRELEAALRQMMADIAAPGYLESNPENSKGYKMAQAIFKTQCETSSFASALETKGDAT